MRTTKRARPLALGLLAAVSGTAALVVAVLAAAGAHVCHHHVLAHAPTLAGGLTGMAMPVSHPDADEGLCPVLTYAAGLAAALCLLALLALLRARARNPAVLTALARLVAGQRLAPLTAAVGLAGAIPLLAILALDGGMSGVPALAGLAGLLAGALLTALGLAAAARAVISFAERLVVALAAVFSFLARGAETPWALRGDSLFVPAGVRLARRRPSRAPPVRR